MKPVVGRDLPMTRTKGKAMSNSTKNPSLFRHLWKSVLGLGLLSLALGVVVLVWPGQSVVAAAAVFGVYLFHDFKNGAAVWVLAAWIGLGFLFQGVAVTVLAINHKELPERGWYIFAGVLSVLAGIVVIALPISSIVVLAIVVGAWLVVIGITQIVWALKARTAGVKVEHVIDSLKKPTAVG